MKKMIVLVCLSAVVVAGCLKGKTVATVGSQCITAETIQKRISETPPMYRSFLSTPAGKKQFIDLLVRERAVVEAARKNGYESRKEYKDSLAQFKKEQERRIIDYKESLLMETYLQDLRTKDFKVTPEEIEGYYTAHATEYSKPTEVVARHILVATKEEAEKALARVTKGEDFAKVATDVSTDAVSAKRGGEIGPFRKGDLLPEFEAAVYPLKNGQTSGIVQTQFGFHIIRKVSEKAMPAIAPDQAKAEIARMLEKKKFDTWLESTKTKYGVKIDYDAVAAIQLPPENPMPMMQQEMRVPAPKR